MIKIIITLMVLLGSASVFSSEMDFREKCESLHGAMNGSVCEFNNAALVDLVSDKLFEGCKGQMNTEGRVSSGGIYKVKSECIEVNE